MTYKFKDPKTVDEQIEYLAKNKRVVFNDMSKEEAKEILHKYNYINIISPFKHHFFKQDKIGNAIKDANNNHIYESDVDFNEYYQYYLEERSKYPTIYKNVSEIENILKSVIAYEAINYYNLNDSDRLIDYLNAQKSQIDSTNYSYKMKNKMKESIESIIDKVDKYQDVYILFDRLSFNEATNLFRLSPANIQNRVYDMFYKNNITYGCSSAKQLDDLLKIIIPIRNYVCHENSLTVLERYHDIENHALRNANERKQYHKLIDKLSKEKANS